MRVNYAKTVKLYFNPCKMKRRVTVFKTHDYHSNRWQFSCNLLLSIAFLVANLFHCKPPNEERSIFHLNAICGCFKQNSIRFAAVNVPCNGCSSFFIIHSMQNNVHEISVTWLLSCFVFSSAVDEVRITRLFVISCSCFICYEKKDVSLIEYLHWRLFSSGQIEDAYFKQQLYDLLILYVEEPICMQDVV